MSAGISYSPESMTYTLFDGTNSLKLPNWAHRAIHEEFEREVRPLRNSIDVLSGALDASRKDKERLEAENAKLRQERREYQATIDSLVDECADHKAENEKLQELFNETLIRLAAASEAAGGGFMDARYCELLESHGIEVIE